MHGVRMTPKTLVLIGTLMQFIGAFGIGWSLLEYRWTGEFNTIVCPWTTAAFVAYVLGYIPTSWESIAASLFSGTLRRFNERLLYNLPFAARTLRRRLKNVI